VGSGFAGLAAADLLGGHDLRVLLVDENRHLGGQVLRRMPLKPGGQWRLESDPLKRIGFGLTDGVRRKGIEILNRAQVFGTSPKRVLYIEDLRGRIIEAEAEYIVFAAGAREKFLPFRGWTLPGVISTGAAQILMKSSGVLPAAETLVGGSGPLLLVLANEILKNGGRVPAVLDGVHFLDQMKFLTLWRHQSRKLIEIAIILSRLLASRVPVKHGVRILEARGKGELEEVITIRIDRQGRNIPGTEAKVKTACLAVGHGFASNLELPQLAGCKMEYRADRGGWIVSVDEHLETSVANVFAAGELTGIAGSGKAFLEGQMAALAILRKFGLLDERGFFGRWAILHKERQRQLDFGKFVNDLCRIPPASYAAIPDETIVCRCEDVTMGEIRRQIRSGFSTPGALKKATRSGMGYCQGRVCGPMLQDLSALFSGKAGRDLEPLPVRMPVKPVRLEVLAGLNERA
jgi:NADPH-dependent 2,4-dienoyl-CoA reductase/sulfur reductase-like enzyme/bacterioferritin-associated ferredoxin